MSAVNRTVRVRSYRRVSEVAQIGRGLTQATPLTLEDVKEASGKVSARALEAALVETGSSFDLSGKDLLALQDAKVPASVTDLIVALSYPDRFVVERTARTDRTPMAPLIDDPFFVGWAFGYPMWSDAYGFYSPFYGPYAPYFYSPFYSYLPWYHPYYSAEAPSSSIDGDGSERWWPDRIGQADGGRVVDGLGYTRVRPREAEPTPTVRSAQQVPAASVLGRILLICSSGGGGGSVSSQGFSSGGSRRRRRRTHGCNRESRSPRMHEGLG